MVSGSLITAAPLFCIGISPSYHIAKFWGVTAEEPALAPAAEVEEEVEAEKATPTPEPLAETWVHRLRTRIKRTLQAFGVRDRGPLDH